MLKEIELKKAIEYYMNDRPVIVFKPVKQSDGTIRYKKMKFEDVLSPLMYFVDSVDMNPCKDYIYDDGQNTYNVTDTEDINSGASDRQTKFIKTTTKPIDYDKFKQLKELGWTAEQLAEEFDVSQSTIYKYIRTHFE